MEKPRFNTDSEALSKRMEAHEKFGENDLNEWIFSELNPSEGMSILDLGCGRGKQSVPLAQIVGSTGHIISLDVSSQSLEALMATANEQLIAPQIELANEGLDDFAAHGYQEIFDRALSSYALYYSKEPERLLRAIEKSLKKGGLFFFCGPSSNNNKEIKDFHLSLGDRVELTEAGGSQFMETTGLELAKEIFETVGVSEFSNTLRFDSPDALFSYWSSYNLYDPTLENQFKERAEEHFHSNEFFETVKRVIGVRAQKTS